MGRRLRQRLARFALMVGGPLLVLWCISLGLHHNAVRELRRTLGPSTNPGYIDHVAEQLVARRMNAWIGENGPAFPLVMLGFICLAIHISFVWPTPRVKKLRTRRLVLRRYRPEDVPALHRILTDPATLRYWGHAPHQSLAETARWLEHTQAGPHLRDEFMIERDGEVIGMVGTRQWPWVTYVLLDAEGGKGYGSEALKAFVDYAFDLGVPVLLVATDARNEASLAMVRRRGFREVERQPITHATGETIEGVLLRLDRPAGRRRALRRAAALDKALA